MSLSISLFSVFFKFKISLHLLSNFISIVILKIRVSLSHSLFLSPPVNIIKNIINFFFHSDIFLSSLSKVNIQITCSRFPWIFHEWMPCFKLRIHAKIKSARIFCVYWNILHYLILHTIFLFTAWYTIYLHTIISKE